MMLTTRLSKKLSEGNPQLWRELKARLKWQTVAATIAASLLGQFILMTRFQESWSGKAYQQGLYRAAFSTLFWVGLFLLVIGGSYWLVKDMAREEKRGTMDFLRLTPEPSEKILLGKLLGVPILLYLAIVLALPLHLNIALRANLNPISVLSAYALAISVCSLAYSYALLYALAWRAKARPSYPMIGIIFGYLAVLLFWSSLRSVNDLILWTVVTLGGAALIGILTIACWELAVFRLRHPPELPPSRPKV
ncbi:MAG TPA: hypothetical protein V6D18_02555 [Thermosynechococcaceae cyanobacterium]